jgi:DNA-binding transcriptional regulator YhcF (GntR family)
MTTGGTAHGRLGPVWILSCVAGGHNPTCSDTSGIKDSGSEGSPNDNPVPEQAPSPAGSAEALPPSAPASASQIRKGRPKSRPAAEVAREEILARIIDGTWAGDRYPVLTEMGRVLHMGLHTLSNATRMLAAEGVLHKVAIPPAPGRRGRSYVWRPVTVAPRGTEDDARQLEQDIRTGRLTGQLPRISEIARQRHIDNPSASRVYRRLQEEGVIDLVWLPDLSHRVWRVLGPDDERDSHRFRGDCRALVIAHALIRRMPEWLVRRPRNEWARTFLPDIEPIRIEYRTHFSNAELALELLVVLRIVERQFVLSQRRYLPLPPSKAADTLGREFRQTSGYLGRDWFPVTDTADWLSLPTSKDDPLVQQARSQAQRYRRHKPRGRSGGMRKGTR